MLLSLYIECSHSGINCTCAKLFFNSEELVVLCNTLTSAGCACLDLAGVESNCKVCDCCIGSLAGTVRRNCSVACLVSHLDSFKCFGNRTDLVELDKDRVAAAKADTLCKSLGVGYEQIVADQLYLAAKLLGKLLPAFPVLFVQSVLDGDDGILFNKLLPVSNKLGRCELCACLGENVFALLGTLPLTCLLYTSPSPRDTR